MFRYSQHVPMLMLMLLVLSAPAQALETLKPFILASTTSGDFNNAITGVKNALSVNGFSVVGEYAPYADTHIIIVTNDALKRIAAKTERGGYGAAQRVSVTRVGEQIQVSYANPHYIQHAYHLAGELDGVATALERALGNREAFGAKGLSLKKLENYHYTFGMEYFDDVYKLKDFDSHQEALDALEAGLASAQSGVSKIYRIDIPGTQNSVFGVAFKSGEKGNRHMDDAFQMGEVDFREVRASAYLPYEVLVRGKRVEALHMRFRMAVHFPDLKMMGANSFMRLRKSPAAIEAALVQAVGGRVEEEEDF